ncbi:MAG: PIN domain-containing protein [Chloroflexota bacterium]|nr:MAG: PIN domain-containing protein [Chloroflexota bacterium]
MTLVVDASVWMSVFWPDDPRHAISRAWIERQVGAEEQLLIPALALPEVAGPIRRRTGAHYLAQQAVNAMLDLPGVTIIPITEELGKLSGELAGMLCLRGADAVYAALAFMQSIPLVSWDQEHIERCPGHVATRTPD